MMFADDVAPCAETGSVAEERLEQWRGCLEDRGMKVGRKKTEYLCMGGGAADIAMQGRLSRNPLSSSMCDQQSKRMEAQRRR